MNFGIKQARLISGLKQCEIAKVLGIHVQTYRKIEQNPDNATISQAKIIAELVGIPYDQIFFNNNSTLSRYKDAKKVS